jgi:hypothetical protein
VRYAPTMLAELRDADPEGDAWRQLHSCADDNHISPSASDRRW